MPGLREVHGGLSGEDSGECGDARDIRVSLLDAPHAGIGTLASAAEAAAATRTVLTVLGALEVLAAGYLGWRALFRQAVLASPDSIIVQNRFRTHRVSASDIGALCARVDHHRHTVGRSERD